jgi:ribonuclease Z
MELTFLGTASNNPSPVRGVSCTCFRHEGEAWLFDAGEATQIQLMKSTIKPGRITKIFITHMHGDHIFGLPGLMCTVGANVVENKKLEVYGPLGLRRYIRTCLELSRSFVTYSYAVHEMVPLTEEQIPEEIRNWPVVESDDSRLHPSETLGRQIYADKNGHWDL